MVALRKTAKRYQMWVDNIQKLTLKISKKWTINWIYWNALIEDERNYRHKNSNRMNCSNKKKLNLEKRMKQHLILKILLQQQKLF